MKNKKGFLLAEETLKMIIAVISIGILAYLLFSLYNAEGSSQDEQFAEATLERLITEILNGAEEVAVYNPEDWILDENKEGGKLCICHKLNQGYCEEKGICKNSDYDVSGFVELENLPIILEINHDEKRITKK